MDVGEFTVNALAATLPNFTAVVGALTNPVPVIATTVPPA
jgi:hypothetical protein